MQIDISLTEKNTLLSWEKSAKEHADRYGDGNAVFSNEISALDKIRSHEKGPLKVSHNDIMVMLHWAESAVDKNFGGGAITNPIEHQLLEKIKKLADSKSRSNGHSRQEESKASYAAQRSAFEEAREGPRMLRRAIAIMALVTVIVFIIGFIVGGRQRSPGGSSQAARPKPVSPFEVTFVMGDVLTKKGGESWKLPKMGQVLRDGDSIKTNKVSVLELMSGNGFKRKIGEMTTAWVDSVLWASSRR